MKQAHWVREINPQGIALLNPFKVYLSDFLFQVRRQYKSYRKDKKVKASWAQADRVKKPFSN